MNLKIFFTIYLTLISSSFSQELDRSADYNNKGIAALSKNEYLNAIANFEKALYHSNRNPTIKGNLTNTYNNYAVELSKKNKFSEACLYLEKALSLDPVSAPNNNFLKTPKKDFPH